MGSRYLLGAGGGFSIVAALLHIAIIFGGADWYRFFGAGEGMARLTESGSTYPTMVTSAIASVLLVWGLYGLSGARAIPRLPLLPFALVLIGGVYLLRGVAGLVLLFLPEHPIAAENSPLFWLVSSLVCLVPGTLYLLGVITQWGELRAGRTR
ncbi:MAG: hypothetical protein AAF184_16895 [Pseudomonadota bacterium]